jgi:hypothetical protein
LILKARIAMEAQEGKMQKRGDFYAKQILNSNFSAHKRERERAREGEKRQASFH